MKAVIALLLIGSATPAFAQHSGHQMEPGMVMPTAKPTSKPAPKPVAKPAPKSAAKPSAKPAAKPATAKTSAKAPALKRPLVVKDSVAAAPGAASPDAMTSMDGMDGMEGMDHSTMDHSAMDHSAMKNGSVKEGQMDHGAMDHGSMNMGSGPMDHAAMGHAMTAAPNVETPPPAAPGNGPARAADAIWGADAMAASRAELAATHGGQQILWFMADRAEYRARDGRDGYVWDLQGSYGGDLDKVFFKSEGEGSFGERIERAEVQALWSHAIAPFFDLQTGIRQDVAPRDRTYAVIGVQGLAPYRFEVDSALFLSDRGDLTARLEAELDQRISQRLILQPRVEVNLSAQNVPELGIGAGLDRVEAGLRLRYEIAREFAPYIGMEQEWKSGRSARYARNDGEDPSVTSYVIGIRAWF
ncbi:MAG: copper resistance protein B [Novosphingopyxis baekryungensis]|nr:copper resistance protein B [Novosphingopyxis baekryungensis]